MLNALRDHDIVKQVLWSICCLGGKLEIQPLLNSSLCLILEFNNCLENETYLKI